MSGCRQEPSGLAQDSIPDRMFAFEQAINSLKLFYWPADKITPAVLASIQPGDVLGFTCYSPHLDIHHLGFAVKQTDGIHVLNASSFTKKVGVSKLPLPGYLKHNTSYSGIMAMRPVALRK